MPGAHVKHHFLIGQSPPSLHRSTAWRESGDVNVLFGRNFSHSMSKRSLTFPTKDFNLEERDFLILLQQPLGQFGHDKKVFSKPQSVIFEGLCSVQNNLLATGKIIILN